MEYYDKLFRDYLNEEGGVSIAGSDFLRDIILQTLDESLYNEAYLEWLDQRKVTFIEKADEILEQFDQEDRFNNIKGIYTRGMLIPFIGAGLSIPSNYPGWTDFLYKLHKQSEIEEEKFDHVIKSGDYEEAAQLLLENLTPGSFFEQIENIFSATRIINGIIQRIPSVFKKSVITTNFDNVIDRCYSAENINFDEILIGKDALLLPKILAEGKTVLLKLHGVATNTRGRILTKEEYISHYQESRGLIDVIEVLSHNSLLFLGCSLTVDRTILCLRELMHQKGHSNMPRHYAFLKLENEAERISRQKELAKANIFPIWYTDDHNECLEALLEKLIEGNTDE